MERATKIVRRVAVKSDRVVDLLVLARGDRSGEPAALTTQGGLAVALDLDKPAAIEDGDALALEDGRLIVVRAAPERLLEVSAENPLRLVRLAWQLGGHHVPTELAADALYLPDEPANAEFVRDQGCAARPVERAFRPERLAHRHGPDCGHDHAHHEHGHDHGHHAHPHHEHGHEHEHEHEHEHHGHEHHEHKHREHDHHGHDHRGR